MTSLTKDRIAIIGIGCRFPGGVNDTESFWKLLVEEREAVGEVPADRWNVERFFDAEPGLPGKSIARRGGFLDRIDQFDPQFFGISPREAPYVDPQHRLLLETAWEAMEDAGLVLDLEQGTDLGVFVGISHNEYQGIQGTPWEHSGIGPALAHRLRAQYCREPHLLLLQSARPQHRDGYCLFVRADGGACCLRAYSGRPRRYRAGGRSHRDYNAWRIHRLFAGFDAFSRRGDARRLTPRLMASFAAKGRAWCS